MSVGMQSLSPGSSRKGSRNSSFGDLRLADESDPGNEEEGLEVEMQDFTDGELVREKDRYEPSELEEAYQSPGCCTPLAKLWASTVGAFWAVTGGRVVEALRDTRAWPLLSRHSVLLASSAIAIFVLIVCGASIWRELTWQGWIAVCVVAMVLVLLISDTYVPEFTMMLGVVILLITTVVNVQEALAGFSSSGVATIAVLFIVAKGIELSGVLKYVLRYVLKRPKWLFMAQLRLLIPVAVLSAFTNNTPIVAMMVPLVQSWCRQTGLHASKLLMPLSFATIMGGTCTLIGTSTNLVVISLLEDSEFSDTQIGFFEVGILGLPVTICGFIYILLFSNLLLPVRSVGAESFAKHPREYTAAVRVREKSPTVGKTMEEAGLRHLPNVYLMEIQRESGEILPAPPSTTILNAGDLLYFVGVISHMTAVYEVDGLEPAGSDQVQKLANVKHHILCEAVIGNQFPYIGLTVAESQFRTRYNAAIISVHRSGERINQKIGEITLKTGDTLLIETSQNFIDTYKDSSHFFLTSRVEGLDTVLPKQDVLNMLFVALPACIMVVVAIANLTSLLAASLVVASLYIITKRLSVKQALHAVKADLLIIIAAGFAIGTGLDNSGASAIVANSILPAFQLLGGDFGILLGLFVITAFLSSFITNAAAVTLMFPVAAQFLAGSATLSVKSVVFTLMLAASSSFGTPVGYQTNLLVQAAGGYKNKDYAKFGLPLTCISCIVTVPLAFFLWSYILTPEA